MILLNPKTRALTSTVLAISLAVSVITFRPAHARETTRLSATPAQTNDNIELHQALLDLTNPWTVMCVAAHPDDEDGTTLTVLRRKLGVHTVSLFSTYGEGGQNAVGPELYEDLGVIRARETMAAAEIQGSEPHFLGLTDFGFSKSADEAFRIWGHEEALKRMVLQIRQLRPDVIITNHDTTSGHGHHQATGRLLLEAFDAAADPKRFSAQLKDGLEPWQVQRVFVRGGFGGGGANAGQRPQTQGAPDKLVTVDPNERDPIRGTTFIEQALTALQRHATQGPWPKTIDDWLRSRGNANGNGPRTFPLVRYRLVREAQGVGPLPQNPSNVLDGLVLPATTAARLAPPTIAGQPLTEVVAQRAKVLVGLLVARKAGAFTVPASPVGPVDARRFQLMSSRLDRAIAVASGATLSLSASESVLVPGVATTFTAGLGNTGEDAIHVKHLAFQGWGNDKDLNIADLLPPGTETSASTKAVTPKSAAFTVPTAEHLYDEKLFGQRLTASATLEINGVTFAVNAATKIDVAPAVEIRRVSPSPYIFTPQFNGQPLSVNLQVVNHLSDQFNGTVQAPGFQSSFKGGDLSNLRPNEIRDVNVSLSGKAPATARRGHTASSDRPIQISIRRAGSPEEVTSKSVPGKFVDARIASTLRVGYVPSFDQTLAQSLAALGVEAKELTVADIQNSDLSSFSTIVIDNRGYEAHPELIAANARLLKYAEDGGTLIVFYHKSNEWNPDANRNRPQLAPYPIVLGNERVTDETAPITFIQRDRLLEYPNAITAADFKDWIQERGLYYPKEWDSHYVAPFATNDPGEAPLKGGLLATSYGRGHYIYTSMVWYRELRAGVPGAYRMFANMISYGH